LTARERARFTPSDEPARPPEPQDRVADVRVHPLSGDTAVRSSPRTDSPLFLRILGVMAAAVLGVGTFSVLGVAVMQTLYDHGVVGHKGFEEMEALGYLAAGLIGGAAVGLAVSVWVGLRVWQSRWALLAVLVAVAAVTGITIVVATR